VAVGSIADAIIEPPPAGAAPLSRIVAASHGVSEPVLVTGFAVVPVALSTRSWTSSSMSPVGDTFVRTLYAESPVSEFEKPESA
jgi:hypothetical protein